VICHCREATILNGFEPQQAGKKNSAANGESHDTSIRMFLFYQATASKGDGSNCHHYAKGLISPYQESH
jgi:hypothetical protein